MLIITFVASLSWADDVEFVVNVDRYVRLVAILLTKSVTKEIKGVRRADKLEVEVARSAAHMIDQFRSQS